MKLVRLLLFPFSIIYGLILYARNWCYSKQIFRSFSPNIPTICLGNLSMGGTGKTPHTKWLLTQLDSFNFQPVVLSRGYGRKTKGFYWVQTDGDAYQFGDEPLEIKRFSSKTPVAVCEQRVFGIKQILKEYPQTDVIILDDAFQHRKLKCSYYLLLTTLKKPFYTDFIFPSGTLRDNRMEAARANNIIVTKTPPESLITPPLQKSIAKYSNAKVYSSSITYQQKLTSFHNKKEYLNVDDISNPIILLTGLANPTPFANYWGDRLQVLEHLSFPDHHNFSKKDFVKIKQLFDIFANRNPLIITTSKDSMRLELFKETEQLQNLPIYVSGMDISVKHGEDLIEDIVNHIRNFKHVERHI